MMETLVRKARKYQYSEGGASIVRHESSVKISYERVRKRGPACCHGRSSARLFRYRMSISYLQFVI